MSREFSLMFSPITIGSLTMRNRVAMQPTSARYASKNVVEDRHISYYRARARGGAGLLITEAMPVHPTTPRPGSIFAYDRRGMPGLERLARAVHEFETPIIGQIGHGGRQFTVPVTRVTWGVSAIADVMHGIMPHEMSTEEVEELVEAFVQSAANLHEAGFDGIDLHAAQGHLCQQFLSPWTNCRTDRYGGSLENRMRFMMEIIDGVRSKCGRRFVVGVRLCGDEFTDGGLTPEDVKEIAIEFAATGKVDYFAITQGNFNGASFSTHIADMSFPPAPFVHLAAGIKEVVDLPVMAMGRILEPYQAERLLQEGVADIIGLCRALITDPEWVRKTREGRADEIRPCISCNQACQGTNRPLTCLINPTVGKEEEWDKWVSEPPARVKKVVVVGGGPGGMSAARVAASKGHHVVLFERDPTLGGQVKLASSIPSRAEMDGVTRYLTAEVARLKVDLRVGVEATANVVLAERPDAVIVATGAEPELPEYARDSDPPVVTVASVLQGAVSVGRRVLLVDDDGHHKAAAVAEWLADQGREVQIVTRFASVGMKLPTASLPAAKQRLYLRHVIMTPDTQVIACSGGRVTLANFLTGETTEIDGIDTVVVAGHHRANSGLFEALTGKVPELHAVGDCLAPRLALDAIHDGHEVAMTL